MCNFILQFHEHQQCSHNYHCTEEMQNYIHLQRNLIRHKN